MKTNDYKQERAIQLLFRKKITKKFIAQKRPITSCSIFFSPDRVKMRRQTPRQKNLRAIAQLTFALALRKRRRELRHPT
jgi:hypothetical protein